MREGTLFDLVDRIHAAPLEEGGWRRLLDGHCEVFQATWACLFRQTQGPDHVSFWAEGGPEARRRWPPQSAGVPPGPWVERVLREKPGRVFTFAVPAEGGKSEGDDARGGASGADGASAALGVRLDVGGGGGAAAATGLVLRSPPGCAPYGSADREGLRLVVPHLRRALTTAARLREAGLRDALARGVLRRMGAGVILLEAPDVIVWMNRRARAMLAGGALRIRSHRLACDDAELQDRLRAALAKASARGLGSWLRLAPTRAEPAWVAGIWPLRPEVPPERVCFLAVVLAPAEAPRELSPALVADLLGLTRAEAAVAVGLAAGRDVRTLARRRGVSPETVRSQLKSVLAKTGCARQSELVRLLLAGPTGWPDPRG